MTRRTTRPHNGISTTGSIRAPAVRTSAIPNCPWARQPGAAKAHPKGLSDSTRPIIMSPEPSSPCERVATRLSRLGMRAAPMTATPPMAPMRSRPRRVVDAPVPITTMREVSTQVARATGARTSVRPAAAQCPLTAHTRAGRTAQTPVAMPGIPAAPATASPLTREREGAIHGASARGSSVESTPVSRSGTRVQPRVASAPRAPMVVEASGVGA